MIVINQLFIIIQMKLQKKATFQSYRIPSRSISLRNDKIYQIVCRSSDLVLCQEAKVRKFKNVPRRVMGTIQDKNNTQAIWLIKQAVTRNGRYELVHFKSDNVLDTQNQQVQLTRGRQKSSQLYQLEPVKSSPQYFRIKNHMNLYLGLKGILQLFEMQQADLSLQFTIKQYDPFESQSLKNTFMIYEQKSKLCLDLKDGGNNEQSKIIAYQPHYRSNQRWVIDPPFEVNQKEQQKEVLIKNYLTGRYLSSEKDQVVDSDWKDYWVLKNIHTHKLKFIIAQLFHKRSEKYLKFRGLDRVQMDHSGSMIEFISAPLDQRRSHIFN